MTPDGSTVVFEVTDQFSLFRGFVPAPQKGFWVVRADGSGLRQLTSARGLREGADGSFAVELAGPWAIARRFR